MLYLIGLGLDKKDISFSSIEKIKKCKKIYLESYTISFPYPVKDLEKFLSTAAKKKIKLIISDRELMENNIKKIIREAKYEDIAILIYGDPLAATTHASIIEEAKQDKIKYELLHAPSIFTGISNTGLQLYKFGKTTSIPKWQDNFKPMSFFNIILENQAIKAHTLILSDIGLKLEDALRELAQAAIANDKDILGETIFICSKLGTRNEKITRTKISQLIKDKKLQAQIKEPFCFVYPGEMHFFELKE